MSLVTPNVALGIFVIVIIVAAIVAWLMGGYSNYEKGSFHTFIAILIGLGVFVTFMFYFSVIELQQQQQELAAIQELSRISDSQLNGVLNEIKSASKTIPNFVLSITPLTNTICQNNIPPDPIDPVLCTQKMVLSCRIFSLWQDVIVADTFLVVDALAYVCTFLQYANSPQLAAQWEVAKLNFSSETQEFGDLLFDYGLEITDQVPESYIIAAKQLMASKSYKDIFPKRQCENK